MGGVCGKKSGGGHVDARRAMNELEANEAFEPEVGMSSRIHFELEQMLSGRRKTLETITPGANNIHYPREISRAALHTVEQIGTGQFGVVVKAVLDERKSGGVPGYMVAAKVLKSGSAEGRKELLMEAAIMSQVSAHDNVVTLIGLIDGDPLILVLPFCEHGSLYAQLQDEGGALGSSTADLISYCKDVARGMDHLAGHSIVHRDLAARNVLVDSAQRCMVADFGLARSINAGENEGEGEYYRTQNGVFPVRWTAPEAMVESRFTTMSDVWSFGILMIEVFTKAARPYPGMTQQEVMATVTNGQQHPKPAACPLSVYRKAIAPCWRLHPTARIKFSALFAICDELMQALAVQPSRPSADEGEGYLKVVAVEGGGGPADYRTAAQLKDKKRPGPVDFNSQKQNRLYSQQSFDPGDAYLAPTPTSSAPNRRPSEYEYTGKLKQGNYSNFENGVQQEDAFGVADQHAERTRDEKGGFEASYLQPSTVVEGEQRYQNQRAVTFQVPMELAGFGTDSDGGNVDPFSDSYSAAMLNGRTSKGGGAGEGELRYQNQSAVADYDEAAPRQGRRVSEYQLASQSPSPVAKSAFGSAASNRDAHMVQPMDTSGLGLGLSAGGMPEVVVAAGSRDLDTAEAIMTAADQLLMKLGGRQPSIILVAYTCVHNGADIVEGVNQMFPGVPMAGSTSCRGAIMNGAWFSFKMSQALVLWTLADPTGSFEVVHVKDKGEGAGESLVEVQRGLEAAKAARGGQPSFGLMFGAPGGEDDILSTIRASLGDTPVFGGSSGDNLVSGEWEQISLPGAATQARGRAGQAAAHNLTTNGLVMVVAWTRCRVVTSLTSPYAATQHTGVVTKVGASPRDILEIDEMPAAEVYNRWDGGAIQSVAKFDEEGKANVLAPSSFNPLGTQISGQGYYRVLHPAFIDKQAGSVSVFGDVTVGTRLHMMEATTEALIDGVPASALRLIRQGTKDQNRSRCIGALMIFCGGLAMAINDDMPLVCEKLSTMVGYQDHLGICCFGEQGQMSEEGSDTGHGNLMFGCMLFYEPDEDGDLGMSSQLDSGMTF